MIFGFSLLFLSNKTKWCSALSSSLLYFLSNCYVPGRLFTLFYVSVLGYRMDASSLRIPSCMFTLESHHTNAERKF